MMMMMMIRRFLNLWILSLVLCGTLFANENQFELGVVVGAPTGLSARWYLGGSHAIDATLAYSLANDRGMEMSGTYIFDKARSFNIQGGNPLYFYYGFGARIITIKTGKYSNQMDLGARAPFGLNYLFTNPNLDVFVEAVPVFDFVPQTAFDVEFGLGVRYRF